MDFTSKKTIGRQIKEKAAGMGIPLTKLSEMTGIPRDTLERWKREDNKTITMLRDITRVFDELEALE